MATNQRRIAQLPDTGLDYGAEQVVRIQPPQFFGQAIAQAPARKRNVVHRLIRLGESCDRRVWSIQMDGPRLAHQCDPVDTDRCGIRHSQLVLDRNLQLELQPGGEKHCRWGVG